jgi:hypothetical protein
MMWCRGHDGNGHEVWRGDRDSENNSFCNACKETISMCNTTGIPLIKALP